MADLDSIIDDLVVGNAYALTRTITAVPSGDTLARAWWTVKRSEYDADADAIFQVEVTSTLAAAGQITDTGADNTGAVTLNATAAQTGKLIPKRIYAWDLQVLTTEGHVYTPESGSLIAHRRITRDSS